MSISVTGSREVTVSAIIAGLVDHLRAHPELLQLDALGHSVIEPNMTADELAAFKAEQMALLTVSANRLDLALSLGSGRGLSILLRSYALVRGLWQSTPFARGGEVVTFATSHTEIAEALHEYWRGALS
nr:hypothetical protein [Lichenibacterium minor]